MKTGLLITLILISPLAIANSGAVKQLMNEYMAQGAEAANPQRGKTLWNKTFSGKAPFTERSCTTCHSEALTTAGKHARTGKVIEALAPSVNKRSLTKISKINKWLKRNCKWTLGRTCTSQEKADILAFISQQ